MPYLTDIDWQNYDRGFDAGVGAHDAWLAAFPSGVIAECDPAHGREFRDGWADGWMAAADSAPRA